jgi:hypothetical protein
VAKKVENTPNLIKAQDLTGDPVGDLSLFLKSKEKDFEFGLKLIKAYTKNHALYLFLKNNADNKKARKIMIDNIKIIYHARNR